MSQIEHKVGSAARATTKISLFTGIIHNVYMQTTPEKESKKDTIRSRSDLVAAVVHDLGGLGACGNASRRRVDLRPELDQIGHFGRLGDSLGGLGEHSELVGGIWAQIAN